MRQPNRDALEQAGRLWREGAYWEVHEVLEPAWLAARGPERDFLHALILAAAALEARRRGHARGARSNLAKAMRRWRALTPPDARLGAFLEGVGRALEGAPPPPWPLDEEADPALAEGPV
ncbi:DUF309 domain-containing protein [Oceanithermus profundus]